MGVGSVVGEHGEIKTTPHQSRFQLGKHKMAAVVAAATHHQEGDAAHCHNAKIVLEVKNRVSFFKTPKRPKKLRKPLLKYEGRGGAKGKGDDIRRMRLLFTHRGVCILVHKIKFNKLANSHHCGKTGHPHLESQIVSMQSFLQPFTPVHSDNVS